MAGSSSRSLDGALHGRRGAGAPGGAGDRSDRQLLQPGLFGGPTDLPWGLHIAPAFRPAGYGQYATFHPTFLYELLFDFAWAGFLVWLGRRERAPRPPGLFALYVFGYSAFRVFEETLRIDYSQHFFGLRLNTFVAGALAAAALAWFVVVQLRGRRTSEA